MLAPLRDRGCWRAGESAKPNFGVYGKLKACRKNYPLCSENPTANEEAKQSFSSKRILMETKETETKQRMVAEKSPMPCLQALNLLSLLEYSGPSELLNIRAKIQKNRFVLEPRPF